MKCSTHWKISRGKLSKEYVFQNFVQAFGFMTSAALYAEKNDHHPEWTNVYNSVVVQLTTHSANGVTEKDFAFANEMELFFSAHTVSFPK